MLYLYGVSPWCSSAIRVITQRCKHPAIRPGAGLLDGESSAEEGVREGQAEECEQQDELQR